MNFWRDMSCFFIGMTIAFIFSDAPERAMFGAVMWLICALVLFFEDDSQ